MAVKEKLTRICLNCGSTDVVLAETEGGGPMFGCRNCLSTTCAELNEKAVSELRATIARAKR